VNVRCPECKTLFRLADDKVGAHGAKVRCGKCRHVFIATRPDSGATADTAPPPTFAPPPIGPPPPAQPTLALSANGLGDIFPPPPPLPPSQAGRPLGAAATSAAVPSAMPAPPSWGAPAPEPRPLSFHAPHSELPAPLFDDSPSTADESRAGDERIDAATAMGRRRSQEAPEDEGPIDAATAMGRGAHRLEEYERERRRVQDLPRAEEAPRSRIQEAPPPEDALAFDDGGFGAAAAAPFEKAPDDGAGTGAEAARGAPLPQEELPAFEDRTTVERPAWLGAHVDGLKSATEASGGTRWDDIPRERLPRAEADAPTLPAPEVPSEPLRPEAPSSLDPEALFEGAEPSNVSPGPNPSGPAVVLAPPPISPAAARIAAQRDAFSRRESEGVRPRRTVERAFASPPGKGAIVRAGGFVLALAGVLAIFVLWRNDWRLESVGMMMARAFGGAGAPRVRTQIPAISVRRVRRDVFDAANGQAMLVVSGELENDGADPLQSISVQVRLVDDAGNLVAEREQHAVGVFEPSVLAGFADALAVEAEFKKRHARSVLRPGSRLEFMIVFYPIPREVEGRRLRMLVEVTGAKRG
jgi:predicted Zn finger-like uncharacterized protein